MNSKGSDAEGLQLVELSGGTKGGSLVDSETVSGTTTNKLASLLEGVRLIFSSTYLLQICAFLWLTAVISSFFYFEVSFPALFVFFCRIFGYIIFVVVLLYILLCQWQPFIGALMVLTHPILTKHPSTQRSAVVADSTQDPLGRRILLAEINSLTAIFILAGQLTVTVSCIHILI